MTRLLLAILCATACCAQDIQQDVVMRKPMAVPAIILGPNTIGAGASQLPAAASSTGQVRLVTDAAGNGCDTGGGTGWTLCYSNGSAWVPFYLAGGSGSGDVIGPATNNADYVPQWDGTNSKTLKNGIAVATSSNASTIAQRNASAELIAANTVATGKTPVDTDSIQTLTNKTVNGVTPAVMAYLDATSSVQAQFGAKAAGPTSSTDNAVARFDSTTGKVLQNSGVTIDDSDNVSTPGTVTAAGFSAAYTGVAQAVEIKQGTDPTATQADNTFMLYAPTAIATKYAWKVPGADAAGAVVSDGSGTLSIVGSTGTGNYVKAGSPTLTTPALGTPSAVVLTNATGLPVTGLVNIGANTLLGNPTGSTGAVQAMAAPAGGTTGCSGTTDKVTWTAGTGWGCSTDQSGGASDPWDDGGVTTLFENWLGGANGDGTTGILGWKRVAISSGGTGTSSTDALSWRLALQSASGGTANSGASVYLPSLVYFNLTHDFTLKFEFTTSTTAFSQCYIGLIRTAATLPVNNGVYLSYSAAGGANYMYNIGNGTAVSAIDSTVAADTTNKHTGTIARSGGTITFTLDGANTKTFCASGCDGNFANMPGSFDDIMFLENIGGAETGGSAQTLCSVGRVEMRYTR